MKRRKLEHSIIIEAKAPHLDQSATLRCSELGQQSLYFRTANPLPEGVNLKLIMRFWDRSVVAKGEIVQFEAYNGSWQGIIVFNLA